MARWLDFFRRSSAPLDAKASAVGRAMVLTPGQPTWSGRDYAAFAKEGYQQNNVAFRAISSIADAVASVHWTAWRGGKEISESPILDLIRNPNPRDSGPQYMRSKVSFLLIAGNGYEEVVRVGGEPREMYQLRPDRMKVIPGPDGYPQAYRYDVGGRKITFPIDEKTQMGDVRHLRLFHPTDDWYGMSPVEPGAFGIDTHNEAGAWMQSLLQKSARPSGALMHSGDGILSDEEFNRLKAQIDDQYAGASNAGRPMLLEGGLDWKQMGLSPVDMALIETKQSAARDVALALGVPPMLLGIPGDNTYSNYQEARLAFWEDTVIPLIDLIAADWTAWLGEAFGGVELRPDLDQVPAIVDKKRTQWEMLDKTASLTLNEKREAMGYGPVLGGDVVMVPMSSIPLSMASDPPDDAPPMSVDDAKALLYGPEAK